MDKTYLSSIIRHVILCLLIINPLSTKSQNKNDTDSLFASCNYEYEFRTKQIIVPTSFLVLGGVGVTFHDKLGNWSNKHHTRVDDYLQYIPVTTNLFLGSCGVEHKHKFTDRLMISATAYIAETAIVNGLKYTVKEKRPDSKARNSWPSGHTATAFTGAELTRLEYGWKVGSIAYGVAIATGVLRVYNNRHWCNDVLAGAGIGILSANIANWLYPIEKKWFKREKSKNNGDNASSISIVPIYQPYNSNLGLALSIML